MRILIAGHGKSGTSALFHSIEPLMPEGARKEFEPLFWVQQDNEPLDALAKITLSTHLVPSRTQDFAHFDKKILIHRDYRDIIVSSTMYSMFVHATIRPVEHQHIDPVIELLEKKEANPLEVNFSAIVDMMVRVTERDLWAVFDYGPKRVLDFEASYKPFLVRYEDYVAGKGLDKLEDFLGSGKINHKPKLEGSLRRLGRTKGSGDWKNWFTKADVERFKPFAQPINEHYGYELDWDLPANPLPDRKYGSKYVGGVLRHPSQQGY